MKPKPKLVLVEAEAQAPVEAEAQTLVLVEAEPPVEAEVPAQAEGSVEAEGTSSLRSFDPQPDLPLLISSLKCPSEVFNYKDSNQIEREGYHYIDEESKQITLVIYGVAGDQKELKSLLKNAIDHFKCTHQGYKVKHIQSFDHFLPYELGRAIKIRPSRLIKGALDMSVGTYLPLPVNTSRNALTASTLKGPETGSIYFNKAYTIPRWFDQIADGSKKHFEKRIEDENNNLRVYEPVKKEILKNVDIACEQTKAQVKKSLQIFMILLKKMAFLQCM